MSLSELTRRHLRLDLLLDASIAYTLEVSACSLHTRCLEATLGALSTSADDALGLLRSSRLLGFWR